MQAIPNTVSWSILGTVLCLASGATAAPDKPIRLRHAVVSTAPISPAGAAAATGAAAGEDRQFAGLFLIQFTDPVTPELRHALRGLGVELVRYVPEDAFIARTRSVALSQLRAVPGVRWAGVYSRDLRLHPALSGLVPGPGAGGGEEVAVSLLLAPGAAAGEAIAARRALRRVDQAASYRFGTVMRGSVARERLAALAESPAVLWIEPAPRFKLYDEVASKIVAGDGGGHATAMQALGYDGSGVTVAVADSGLHNGDAATMHPDLFGRVAAFFHYGTLTDAADEHSHGTHVAGIVAGNGAVGETDDDGALYGLGVAPGATLVAQRIFDGIGNYEAPPTFETLTRDAKSAGADIGSNSWGDDTQGRYDLSAAEFDALVRDADSHAPGDQPYILEFSAGNAGPGRQTVGSPAVAKNVIATGASQNDRFDFYLYEEGQDAMADFSSRGPCEDGRIKPDLVAPGTWIASLKSASAGDENAWAPISENYLYQGGTSQAGPAVSGGAAVFVQYYRESHGATPSPALVKAALINAAADMDDESGTTPIPNRDEGWGRMDLTRLIGSGRNYEFVDQSVLLSTGQAAEQRVVIAGSDEPLRITLAYTDEPALPNAVPALVNDLDLEVTGPDGTLYRGNQFEAGESIPNAPGADPLNNIEAVHLAAPAPGPYLVHVRARNVAEDARRDTPAVDQDFALVVSGRFLPPGASALFLDRSEYRAPDLIRVIVLDPDSTNSPSLEVRLSSGAEPGGELLRLTQVGATALFTNSLHTAPGTAAADGQLQVAHDNTITARYDDASSGQTRLATARADLQPPLITQVAASDRFGRIAVSWETDEPGDSRVLFGTTPALGQVRSNRLFSTSHDVALANLVAGQTYYYAVSSSDRAGNTATHTNGGALFTFVAPTAPAVLLVDGILPGGDLFEPPLYKYTDPLDEIAVDYQVWSIDSLGSPAAEDLAPYRVVIWRLPEISFADPTWTFEERAALRTYLDGGGSLFVASMEVLTRLDDDGASDFRHEILQVPDFLTDPGVGAVTGVTGDPVAGGLSLTLDYSTDYLDWDLSDTITPGTNAAGIFVDQMSSEFAGLRYPRTGVDSPWRLVFLAFPFDAIVDGAPPNTRAGLLERVLEFLAPGMKGKGSLTLDRGAYTLPSLVTLELADSDLAGAGQATVTAHSTTEPGGQLLVLLETTRPGMFRGTMPLVPVTSPPATGRLRAQGGDRLWFEYWDVSAGQGVEASVPVDTLAPGISQVAAEADYMAAYVRWETSEASDALVQFGDSMPLPINRTAYNARLRTSQELLLTGLLPDRNYYYQVVSRDEAGNTTVDDNHGAFYSFRTLRPLATPWVDTLEGGAGDWSVLGGDMSERSWELGAPANALAAQAHSAPNAWGTNLRKEGVEYCETWLFSPAVDLSGASQAALQFWHGYDFTSIQNLDAIEGGELLIYTNLLYAPAAAIDYADWEPGWTSNRVDLTPYVGNVVFLAWHYYFLNLFLEDSRPSGWLLDDISVSAVQITTGSVRVTNNLCQAGFTLTGPASRTGQGWDVTFTALPAGTYRVSFDSVPYYLTPAPQTNTLVAGGTLLFQAVYGFDDTNGNGMSDAWEQAQFGEVSPWRDAATDTDDDGFPDLGEFIAGTDPNAAASRLELAMPLALAGGQVQLDWAAVPGRAYRVLASADAATWQVAADWQRAVSGNVTVTVAPAVTGATRWFRVEVKP
ncbi:MAG: S8 family serine peptidase [Verrucomicrobia bacterium]|nr:S8 family serine peptidase [Verrucomicrobiota bacterium]